jgi:hypothetical protein
MAITGEIIKRGIKLTESLIQKYSQPLELQKGELLKLLINAKDTAFGQYHDFTKILDTFRNTDEKLFFNAFRNVIPIHDYNLIFDKWWSKAREGNHDVAWAGKVKYFALSSGTSGDTTKYIPVTKDMLKSIRKTGVRQLLSLAHFDLPSDVYSKGVLMLGGSTKLKKVRSFYDADLSGITASKIPFWFQRFYKPGKEISKYDDWGKKLDTITQCAIEWDIGIIVGVPAWIQLLIEKIIAHYHLKTIHDIWPNLSVFVHGGVSFEPYKNSFTKLLGREIKYIETYLASEGFFAFQCRPGTSSMKLVLNNGIFYEFIPFNTRNFDKDGNMNYNAETILIDEIVENQEYAMLITTCAGAWRYLIGDVIKFTSKVNSEIIITGRTKHFLSLCGEHLSVDNMNKAISMVEDALNIEIKEFAVTGINEGVYFGHKWYIGCDAQVSATILKDTLDEMLKSLNDDYRIERSYALKTLYLQVIPIRFFYEWLKVNGKEGGQNKFPRVLKGNKLADWENFIATKDKTFV